MSISSSYPVSMLMPPPHFVGEEVASQGGEVSPPVGALPVPEVRDTTFPLASANSIFRGTKDSRAVHEDKVRT